MEKNREWLSICRLEIEKSLGWEPSPNWRNEDFENLGEKIFDKTGVRLSLSTMKRIWGRVRYDNFPNSATLNALAAFVGYKDWRHFGQQHPLKETTEKKKVVDARVWAILGLVVFCATTLLLLSQRNKTNRKKPAPYAYQLSSHKVTDDLPNSVVFTYDAGGIENQEVMIQQSWDSSRRETVDPKGNKHTSIYYYPGYFKAKLVINDSIVKQTPVFIKTKGWKAIAERTGLPVYFNDKESITEAHLVITATQLEKAWNTSEFNDKWLQFSNIKEYTGIDGNEFNFEATIRNTGTVESSLCRKVRIVLLGADNVVIVPLATAGCISNLNLFSGDSLFLGKDHDLSAFGCDFSTAQHVRIQVEHKILKIFIAGKNVMTTSQNQSMGNIVGIRIFFEGPGQIDSVAISSQGKTFDLLKEQ